MSCFCLELLHIHVKIQINSFLFGFAHFMCESSTLSCWQFNIRYYGRTLLRMAEHTSAIVRYHLRISWQQKKDKKKTWFWNWSCDYFKEYVNLNVLYFNKGFFIAQGNTYLHLTHERKLPKWKQINIFSSFLIFRFFIQCKVTHTRDRTSSNVWFSTTKFSQLNFLSATIIHGKRQRIYTSKVCAKLLLPKNVRKLLQKRIIHKTV